MALLTESSLLPTFCGRVFESLVKTSLVVQPLLQRCHVSLHITFYHRLLLHYKRFRGAAQSKGLDSRCNTRIKLASVESTWWPVGPQGTLRSGPYAPQALHSGPGSPSAASLPIIEGKVCRRLVHDLFVIFEAKLPDQLCGLPLLRITIVILYLHEHLYGRHLRVHLRRHWGCVV